MSKSKMHKYEVGKSRPTENRADNAIIDKEVDRWVVRIDEASKLVNSEGIHTQIDAVADILKELAEKIRSGELDYKVMSKVVSRRNVRASLGKIAWIR